MSINYSESTYVDGSAPQDAEVIGQTWLHPNRNGGPDKRFSYNKQIPICLHGVLSLTTDSGLNVILHSSNRRLAGELASCFSAIHVVLKEATTEYQSPKLDTPRPMKQDRPALSASGSTKPKIEIRCPECKAIHSVPQSAIGKKEKCNCGRVFAITEGTQA
jgi:hypothetical protein